MALEQYSNGAQNSLASSVNNSSDPVSVTVNSATNFPSVGNFRIKIDSEILLVTSVSGATFTASRAQEGTTIASHSSGASVFHVVTKASLLKLLENAHDYNTYANRPAAGRKGSMYTPTDFEGIRYYDDGSAWQPVLQDGKLIASGVPTTSTLANWMNQETATLTAPQDGFIRLKDVGDASNDDNRVIYKTTAVTTSLVVTTVGRLVASPQDTVSFGVAFSDGTKLAFAGFIRRADEVMKTYVSYFTDVNTYGGAAATERNVSPDRDWLWIKATYTYGTKNVKLEYSFDGTNWVFGCETTFAGLGTITRLGLFINNYNSLSGNNVFADYYYWNAVET